MIHFRSEFVCRYNVFGRMIRQGLVAAAIYAAKSQNVTADSCTHEQSKSEDSSHLPGRPGDCADNHRERSKLKFLESILNRFKVEQELITGIDSSCESLRRKLQRLLNVREKPPGRKPLHRKLTALKATLRRPHFQCTENNLLVNLDGPLGLLLRSILWSN